MCEMFYNQRFKMTSYLSAAIWFFPLATAHKGKIAPEFTTIFTYKSEMYMHKMSYNEPFKTSFYLLAANG